MTELRQYSFGEALVRFGADERGNLWAPASDLCRVLGMNYQKDGTGKYLAHISDEHKRPLGTVPGLTPQPGLPPQTTMLSEAGIFKLILNSRKLEAEKFQKWVEEEVLPSIRKTGSYVYKEDKPQPKLMVQTRDAAEAAMEAAMEATAARWQEEFKRFESRMVERLQGALDKYAPRRREVPGSVRDTHRQFTVHRGLRCPCCDTVKSSWSDFNIDHYKDRQDPSLTATWAICADCNQSIKDAQLHKEAEPAFLAVQKWLKDWRLNNRVIPSVEVQQGLFEQ